MDKLKEFIEWACQNVAHVGLREGLIGKARAGDVPFAWEMAARYLAGDAATRSDIEMLFEPMEDSDQTPIERIDELKDEEDGN